MVIFYVNFEMMQYKNINKVSLYAQNLK